MKKWKEVMKTKGIYILSLFGTITILAVAAIAMNLMEGDTKEGPGIDLNETPGIVSERQEGTESVRELQNDIQAQENTADLSRNEETDSRLDLYEEAETDGTESLKELIKQENSMEEAESSGSVSQEENVVIPNEKLTEAAASAENTADTQKTEEEVQAVSGMNPETVLRSLSFSAEQGLAWPISGAVILNYSMDHAIYHATLDSYRTNDAILIAGEEGMPVCAAVKGVVTEISEELKTGTTVTMRISEEYSIRYGHLEQVTVKVGDVVEQGKSFAVLGKPSKYYTKEGTCLYLQVLQGDKPVNPMLYLKGKES